VFAASQHGNTPGLIEGNRLQVLNQLAGVGIVAGYCAVVSLAILYALNQAVGLRVSDAIEREGLDATVQGETVQ
jgi:Amt family ammonium transporter